MEATVQKTWKPTVAGVLALVASPAVIFQSFAAQALTGVLAQIVFWGCVTAGIVAIVGGIFALRRRVWGVALAGSICACMSLVSWILGILAIILILLSKNEFK
ncbi:hypothetical protein ACFLXT_03525 [Chloroflexota bacterium]